MTDLLNDSGVYVITCLPTSEQYVGASCNVPDRWKRHLRDLKKQKHRNMRLQALYNQYGAESFEFKLLEAVSGWDTLRNREEHWKNALLATLNITKDELTAMRSETRAINRARLKNGLPRMHRIGLWHHTV